MKIRPLFTKNFALCYVNEIRQFVKWRKVDCLLLDANGKELSRVDDVEVPEHWSDTAANILAFKYLRKAGVPNETVNVIEVESCQTPDWLRNSSHSLQATFGRETSAHQVFHRLAGCWTYWGWKRGIFDEEVDAAVFYCELYYMLAMQYAAPNSPQFFNTGLHWAYGIEGPGASGHFRFHAASKTVIEVDSNYRHPQPHACFLLGVNDDLVNQGGLMDLWLRESRLFKLGSGAGSNFSKIRGKGERLSGGGYASGLMSFLRVGDRSAGAIKSGGVCIVGDTPVMTELGFRRVSDLLNEDFIAFSIHGNKVVPKRATAFYSGEKECVRVLTDKGVFEVSYDHPFLTKTGQYVPAANLRPGFRLSQRKFGYTKDNYPMYRENDDYVLIHRTIAQTFIGNIRNKSVHHRNGNKQDSRIANLQIMTAVEHQQHHMSDPLRREEQIEVGRRVANRLLQEGIHPFVLNTYPKEGQSNPMHRNSAFWNDTKKVDQYKSKKSDVLRSRNPQELQKKAARSKALNFAYKLIENGYDISTYDKYFEVREKIGGTGRTKKELLRRMNMTWGSYENFYNELQQHNHVVLEVTSIGIHSVYDVQVICSSPEDRSVNDYHNFAIGGIGCSDTWDGYVTFSHNTRRAAKLVTLDLDHPEILEFINWKKNEEEKAAAIAVGSQVIKTQLENLYNGAICYRDSEGIGLQPLIDNCIAFRVPQSLIDRALKAAEQNLPFVWKDYDLGWESDPIETVSGQNANNSVRVPDKFMESLLDDSSSDNSFSKPWHLTERTTGNVVETHSVDYLWEQICYAAWCCGDPGLQFDDTINAWHTCPAGGRINTANPCIEYNFLDNTACNLASLNLVRFLKSDEFSVPEFSHAVRLWTVVLEISVYMASYPSPEIAKNSYDYRTLGLGYANLGGLLMRLGIPYDSQEGRCIAADITAIMTGTAYRTSAELGECLGPFPKFGENKEAMQRVLRNHHEALTHGDGIYREYEGLNPKAPPYVPNRDAFANNPESTTSLIGEALYREACRIWQQVFDEKDASYRNAQTTLLAPTGTIALLMDCDTTGVEPDFSIVKYKSLAGGGSLTIANSSVRPALERLGYSVDAILDIEHAIKEGDSWAKLLKSPEHIAVFACATGENAISPEGHLKMVAAVQPFLSGAASKTINLSNSATVRDVSRIYTMAWRYGLKAVSLYRDGCKLTQPLSSIKAVQASAKKLELVLPVSDTSDLDNVVSMNNSVSPGPKKLPNKRTGYTQKANIGGYRIYHRTGEYPDGRLGEIFIDIAREGTTLRSLLNSFAIAVSIGLQNGVPLEEYVDEFVHMKFDPAGPVQHHDRIKFAASIIDYIMRDLAINYLNRTELAHAQSLPDALRAAEQASAARVPVMAVPPSVAPPAASAAASSYGFTGDVCDVCNNATMTRSGTCLRCHTCGSTSGCS